MIDLHFRNSQEHRMKKLVSASAMALVSLSLIFMPSLRAQQAGQGTIQITDPAEFNAYQYASTQSSPPAKAQALENFLTTYPNSVVKTPVLDALIDTYQAMNQPDKALSAANRLLQIDPTNTKAIFMSVYIMKTECGKNVDSATGDSTDPKTCDDAAALAQKGLALPKPDGTSDDDWKKLTGATYPIYHSTIALDDLIAKKDSKDAISEYRTELMLYPPEATQAGPGLVDTLQLAEAYAKPDARDIVQACWFYARAWNFAPAAYKAQIEPKLEYWFKRYHGNLDGLDAVKTAAAQTLFPPATFSIVPAPTADKLAHDALVGGDPMKLNLEDKEFVLANGTPEDAQKLWTILQNQATPVPGIVISDPVTIFKVEVTTAASVKPREFTVNLTNPVACNALPAVPSDVKAAQDYILANGVKADTDALGDLLTDPAHARKIVIDPVVPVINVAVTQDAKDNKAPDFIVNLKTPISCKQAPAVGFEFKLQPADELDATYQTYKAIPATATRAATAQIVLSGGFIQSKKAVAEPVHHKPTAGHHAR
jgi:tetratricopeptide (TPR) repeat protein